MNFSRALELIKEGKKLSRTRASCHGVAFIYLVHGSKFIVNRPPLNAMYKEGTEITYRPHIDLKSIDGSCGCYTPSNEDLLADDWEVVDDA